MSCGHEDGPGHNCVYVEWRNQLALTAEELADDAYPEPLEASAEEHRLWSVRWDAAYHRAMAQLVARNSGLVPSCC